MEASLRILPRSVPPLHDLKKSTNEYLAWDDKCKKNFSLLKEKLASAPVLQPFSLSKQSILAVDASQNASRSSTVTGGAPSSVCIS